MKLLSWNGLHIYPLPAEFTAEVTAEDIAQGVKGSCTDCAISLAVCRALGIPCIGLLATGLTEVTLYSRTSAGAGGRILGSDIACWVSGDGSKQDKFIFNFDRGKEVKPTTFTYTLAPNLKEIQS